VEERSTPNSVCANLDCEGAFFSGNACSLEIIFGGRLSPTARSGMRRVSEVP
jgi:hypothetical protein